MILFRRLRLAILALLIASPAMAQADFATALAGLGGGFGAQFEAVNQLGALGDARAVPVLRALGEGALMRRTADGRLVILRDNAAPIDALSGEAASPADRAAYEPISINNRVRGALRGALGRLVLLSDDPAERQSAAEAVFRARSIENIPLIEAALARETVPRIRAQLELSLAATRMMAPERATRLAAIEMLAGGSSPDARVLLLEARAAAASDADLARALDAAIAGIDGRLRWLRAIETVFQGLSLGSVLLLAAMGLAITFGVMGVINMAHGEMVMIGAYTTFVVQEGFRAVMPEFAHLALFAAIPAAFLVSGAVGVVMERSLIRHLYGRPLETLLMTFGLGMIIQQAVRLYFGAQNREVVSPAWMTGALQLPGGIAITQNRIWIIVFGLIVLGLTMLAIRATRFGLEMRAVTQNRAVASTMGIRAGWIDALTFGFGSGIAGLAGVALSQIDNVSPNLGQSYIVDSFLVVVFGGVGNLAGTLVGSLLLGVLNKLLEPFAGVVLGKIVVLVAVILFIQRRPRGLFALRGRAAEG